MKLRMKGSGSNRPGSTVREAGRISSSRCALLGSRTVLRAMGLVVTACIMLLGAATITSPVLAETLLVESFEDGDLASRGWYDNTNLVITYAESALNSTASAEFRFQQGANLPTSGAAIRHKFQDTETVFVSYYVKYSSNWEGSNMAFHPHEFQLLTNLESDWTGPAETRLTAYIEQNEGVPLMAIQDTLNVDQAQIGVDLTNITENRGVAGCNGSTDGYPDSCYSFGGINRNSKIWRAGQVYFSDNPGPTYKNDWHFIEAQFALNSIVGGIGQTDGILRMWYDGDLIIDYQDVLFRTGENPNTKFNQILIAPYIGGSGSPIDQTFWIDNLSVSTTKCETADFNGDCNVDGVDLGIWSGAYGLSNAADADDDNDSDGADFLMWQRQFDSTSATVSSVPEPASGIFMAMALLSLTLLRDRRMF